MPEAMVRDVFGDPGTLLESDRNPEVLYRRLKTEGKDIPSIYMAIGREDSLFGVNQDFRGFLEAEGADFFYEDGHVRLQPENAAMQPIYADSVAVLGKLVALFRQF